MDSGAPRWAPRTRATRAQLLDAAEQLMLEEGYAAVTSRRVGRKAGISPQLVHYYFRTMDDLFLEVFRRRAEEGFAPVRAGDRGAADAAHDLELADRPARARRSTSSSSRSPTTARRSAPRSRATPNASARCSSRRSRRSSTRAATVARRGHSRGRARRAGRRGATHRARARARCRVGGHEQALAFVEQYLDRWA